MSVSELVKLPNEDHAIIEASISIYFLENFDLDLGKFKSFFNENLREDFAVIKKLYSKRIHLKSLDSGDIPEENLIGYILENKEKEKTKEVVHVNNIQDSPRMTYHLFVYKGWAEMMRRFTQLSVKLGECFQSQVRAVGLHFVDQFELVHTSKEKELIFDSNSDLLPNKIFQVENSHFSLNCEKQKDHTNFHHFERIEIVCRDEIINISNNISFELEKKILLSEFIISKEVRDKLGWCHTRNKDFLKEILIQGVQKEIGLIK